MGNYFNIICMIVVRAVRQVSSLLLILIEGNEMVLAGLNTPGVGVGENCNVLLLQRKTEVFGTLYNVSLADRSSITHSRMCVSA